MTDLILIPDCIGLVIAAADYHTISGLARTCTWIHSMATTRLDELKTTSLETVKSTNDEIVISRLQYPSGYTISATAEKSGWIYHALFDNGIPNYWYLEDPSSDVHQEGDFNLHHPAVQIDPHHGEECVMYAQYADGSKIEIYITVCYPIRSFYVEYTGGPNPFTGALGQMSSFTSAEYEFDDWRSLATAPNLWKWFEATIGTIESEDGEHRFDVAAAEPVCWLTSGPMTQGVYDAWIGDWKPRA